MDSLDVEQFARDGAFREFESIKDTVLPEDFLKNVREYAAEHAFGFYADYIRERFIQTFTDEIEELLHQALDE